jgi:single-strand DNA-binding protein
VADINHVVLVGRLTRDAELKYTNTGTPVCKISLAVNRRRKVDEQWTEEANFFDVVIWGKMGEAIAQYLVKGKQVGIDGELRQNKWEQDGQPRSKVEIIANNVQLLGSKGGSGSGNSREASPADIPAPQKDDFQDDIPF